MGAGRAAEHAGDGVGVLVRGHGDAGQDPLRVHLRAAQVVHDLGLLLGRGLLYRVVHLDLLDDGLPALAGGVVAAGGRGGGLRHLHAAPAPAPLAPGAGRGVVAAGRGVVRPRPRPPGARGVLAGLARGGGAGVALLGVGVSGQRAPLAGLGGDHLGGVELPGEAGHLARPRLAVDLG